MSQRVATHSFIEVVEDPKAAVQLLGERLLANADHDSLSGHIIKRDNGKWAVSWEYKSVAS